MAKSSQFSTIHRQQKMLKALTAHHGIVTRAAKAAGITPQTHYNWYRESDHYAEQVDMVKFQCYEDFKDLVMDAVIKKLQQGNTSVISTCFKAMYGKWPEQMERVNPFKAKIKVVVKAAPQPIAWSDDPVTQAAVREYEEQLQHRQHPPHP